MHRFEAAVEEVHHNLHEGQISKPIDDSLWEVLRSYVDQLDALLGSSV